MDLENIPHGVLEASPDRWAFHRTLLESGIAEPEVAAGFLHFATLELFQQVVNGFSRWRASDDPAERRLLENRILNDARIPGHFVTDAAQPHHTTVHFNGWDESLEPNPHGYTTDNAIHTRFESWFVRTHVTFDDV